MPKQVASLLAANPQLLSAAVRTFYERDPSDLNAASKMKRFPPPRPNGGEWVDAKVIITLI